VLRDRAPHDLSYGMAEGVLCRHALRGVVV
jgi:hypothetical protein